MQLNLPDLDPRPLARTAPSPRLAANAPHTAGGSQIESLFGALLDELDYGVVLLLRDTARVVYVNRAGHWALRDDQCVKLVDGNLSARCPADEQPFNAALAATQRGLRRLVSLGAEGRRVSVALTPIGMPTQGAPALIAVVFGRRRLCEQISVQWFARTHDLTPAETKVLELLCEGLDPRDIAAANEVGMATVRTQVNSIREKTRTPSIRALLQRLATLPPMVNVLRC